MEQNERMNEMNLKWKILSPALREQVLLLSPEDRESVEELRVREGRPLALVSAGKERTPEEWKLRRVTSRDIGWILEAAGQGSIHTILPQLRQGYVAVEGGNRIGVCGSVVVKDGEVTNFRRISSLAVRFSREITGIAKPLLSKLTENGRLQSTLILSPPGGGKTTLLRDLIRCISDGEGISPLRVGVADERGEICGMAAGAPQKNVGTRTDIVDGCPRAPALLMLLRGMNPQVLAMDEITETRDLTAAVEAAGCGVVLLATAHGAEPKEIKLRPVYRDLLQEGIFRRFVWISMEGDRRRYRVLTAEEMEQC